MARSRRLAKSRPPSHVLSSRRSCSSDRTAGGSSGTIGALTRAIGDAGISPSSTSQLKKMHIAR